MDKSHAQDRHAELPFTFGSSQKRGELMYHDELSYSTVEKLICLSMERGVQLEKHGFGLARF